MNAEAVNMKRIITVLLVMGLAVSLRASAYEIKFATVAPEGSTWMNIMQELSDAVEERTDGKVRFRFYSGGVSGDEKDVLRKMRHGQLHAAGFTSQGLGEVVPDVRLLNIPLVLKDDGEVDYVLSKMEPYFNSRFDKQGFVVLGWPEVGFAYVFSTKLIDSAESMRRIKMWVWGDDILVNSLFRNIGITPIPLSLIDVMQSLQTGLIEGVYGSPLSALSLQWNTRVKHVLDMKIAYVPGGVLMTKASWRRLTPEQQKIIMEESKKAFVKLTKESRRENDEAMKIMIKQGMVSSKISGEADAAFFRQVSEKTAAELTGKFYSKELLEEMLGHIKDYRAKSSK
ncbi:MAG TPA: ABC transporter substrate-binding protein [bacterium]|nr:ABC transporter substrate-binding protein [bacterium]